MLTWAGHVYILMENVFSLFKRSHVRIPDDIKGLRIKIKTSKQKGASKTPLRPLLYPWYLFIPKRGPSWEGTMPTCMCELRWHTYSVNYGLIWEKRQQFWSTVSVMCEIVRTISQFGWINSFSALFWQTGGVNVKSISLFSHS